jgi:hypothetical protein
MDDAKKRVELELEELGEKISKLVKFMCSDKFPSLSEEMRYLMRDQIRTMMDYANILRNRLSIWDKRDTERKISC